MAVGLVKVLYLPERSYAATKTPGYQNEYLIQNLVLTQAGAAHGKNPISKSLQKLSMLGK